MSKPRQLDWDALVRFAKYLKDKERYIQLFEYQESTTKDSNKYVNVWGDTDHAGCLETRSTSGGVLMLNKHTVKTWSVAQDMLALSSGEAEYYGLVRCAAQGLGVIALLLDMGIERKLKLKTDASVAKSIASRRGLGKLRHIELNQLWLQEKVNSGKIEIEKVKGTENPADALTKYKDNEAIKIYAQWLNCIVISGRRVNAKTREKG